MWAYNDTPAAIGSVVAKFVFFFLVCVFITFIPAYFIGNYSLNLTVDQYVANEFEISYCIDFFWMDFMLLQKF